MAKRSNSRAQKGQKASGATRAKSKGKTDDTGWINDLTERIGDVSTASTERVRDLVEAAVETAGRTRDSVERNLEQLLGFANLPSRSDYEAVESKLDSLQRSIRTMSRQLQDLQDALGVNETKNGKGRKTTRSTSSRSRSTRSRPSA